MLQQTEGIILQGLPFQEYDRILTLFSREEGLIKLILKGKNKKQIESPPLTQAEFVYLKGSSDLFKCREFSPLNSFQKIRLNLQSLQAACEMMQAILESQLLHHPAPLLYQLLIWSLHKIPMVLDPFFLLESFRLKLLQHEGLLNANALGEFFTEEESSILHSLLHFQTIAEIQSSTIPGNLREKISHFYKNQIAL